jgi:SAM-dependent methyltransferase
MPTRNDQLGDDARLYDRRAATYGADPDDLEHSIPQELEEPYRQDLEEVLGPFDRHKSVLEVGAGNGLFTRLLSGWGCRRVVGTDISAGMISVARSRLPDCEFKVISTEADPDLFRPASFDLIISRQVACHLIDPIAVFECWKTWLQPGGRVAVIDGLWTRKDWGPSVNSAGVLVDDRPLSCTQTWATVAYFLERSGLSVTDRRFLDRVNRFGKDRFTIGEAREPIFRFIVVAGVK